MRGGVGRFPGLDVFYAGYRTAYMEGEKDVSRDKMIFITAFHGIIIALSA